MFAPKIWEVWNQFDLFMAVFVGNFIWKTSQFTTKPHFAASGWLWGHENNYTCNFSFTRKSKEQSFSVQCTIDAVINCLLTKQLLGNHSLSVRYSIPSQISYLKLFSSSKKRHIWNLYFYFHCLLSFNLYL